MKIVAKRKWHYPLSQERLYAKYLVAYVQRKFKVIQSFVPELKDVILTYGIKTNADEDNTLVNAHMDVVIDQMTQAVESPDVMRPVIQRLFQTVNEYALREFNAITKSLFGYPLPEILRIIPPKAPRMDAAVDDEIAKYKDLWVQQNLDLIKSIDAETMQKIRNRMAERIIHNVDANLLTKYLIQDIQELAGNEIKRATLIGVDQVGKLNGQLAQFRQEFAGISEYRWETAHDSRVRPAHRLRQGKIFKWSNPPPDGHPGYPIRCRCVALPVIDLDKIPIRVKPGKFEPVRAIATVEVVAPKPSKDALAGVERGEPMTWQEADTGHVNQHFEEGGGYTINCQSAVVTMEARLRGYNVEVLPNTPGSMLQRLSRQTNLAWIDPKTGKHPKYILETEFLDKMPEKVNTPKRLYKWLQENLAKDGRYTIQFGWKGTRNSGHIVCIGYDDAGKLRMYDPQSDRTYYGNDIADYFKLVKFTMRHWSGRTIYRGPRLLRVDTMDFNKEVANYIMKEATRK